MRSRYFTHSRERDFRLVKDFERKEWFGGIRGEEEFLVRRRARRRRERGGAMSTSIRGDDSFWAETNAAVDGTRCLALAAALRTEWRRPAESVLAARLAARLPPALA